MLNVNKSHVWRCDFVPDSKESFAFTKPRPSRHSLSLIPQEHGFDDAFSGFPIPVPSLTRPPVNLQVNEAASAQRAEWRVQGRSSWSRVEDSGADAVSSGRALLSNTLNAGRTSSASLTCQDIQLSKNTGMLHNNQEPIKKPCSRGDTLWRVVSKGAVFDDAILGPFNIAISMTRPPVKSRFQRD